jgi:purine-nucleoside phosphorylase
MKKKDIVCVEMEAVALYAFSMVKNYKIICLVYLTNSIARPKMILKKVTNLEVLTA